MRIYDFSLFVIDVHLPDGCGLDLAADIFSKDPNAGVIVLTADDSPELRERSVVCGIQHLLNKPFQAVTLRHAARSCLEQDLPEDEEQAFTAVLRHISVLEIIQLKCLSASSSHLQVSSAQSELQLGNLYIVEGQIVHAEVQDASLRVIQDGEAALFEIVRWRGGDVRELTIPSSVKRTLHEPWQSLLLCAAQTADEVQNQSSMVAPGHG